MARLSVWFVMLLGPVAGWSATPLPTHVEPGAGADSAVRIRAARNLRAAEPVPALAARYDLLVYGSTPGGIALAVRAAREDLSVLLVNHSLYLGGMLSSGLSVMDTLHAGARSPIYDELRRAIHDYYRTTYGPDSPQFAASRPGHPKTYYEAHVAERLVNEMVNREPGITTVLGFFPAAASQTGGTIQEVRFQEKQGLRTFTAAARIFADCSYEADLALVAGATYRVGREARSEYNEEHAGRIFMRRVDSWPPPDVDPNVIAEYKTLNLFHYNRWFEIIRPPSTGEGDGAVQAYNIRMVLTTDPANRIIPDRPPPNYDRAAMAEIWSKKPPYSQLLGPLPNQKYMWNMPELIGPQYDYPDGDWTVRERITEQHRQATAGMLYYLQNDPELPIETRTQWRNLGFARDEFGDNGHMPYEVYARQTRRVMGRAIFTENDARLSPGLKRTPVHRDSIGITEWFMDVHACSHERVGDSLYEGELYLNYISHPGQVSYRTILPDGLDNLLVPVCLSSTHVGWGAIRLEPTWMNLAESAAHAAALAVETDVPPTRINPDQLVRRLAERRIMISFFNDVALDAAELWVPAIQYLGTQGFFGSYNAAPYGLVNAPLARVWAKAAAESAKGDHVDVLARASQVLEAEQAGGDPVTAEQFLQTLFLELDRAAVPYSIEKFRQTAGRDASRPISRGSACRLIYYLGSHKADRSP